MQTNKISNTQSGYILGLYFGDGYIHYHKKSRHYTTEFYLNSIKDQDICQLLKEILTKRGHNVFITKDKRGNWLRIKVNSKDLYTYIKSYNPINLEKETKSFKLGFVSGFVDAEGYVGNSTINVTNTDFDLLKEITKMLNELNIRSSLKKRAKSKKDKKDCFRLLISTNIKNKNHISQKILRSYPKNKEILP